MEKSKFTQVQETIGKIHYFLDSLEELIATDNMEFDPISGRLEGTNLDFERACLVHIERLQNGIGDYDSAMLSTFCDAVRMVREYNDMMQAIPPPTLKEKGIK